ncbi:MAG TPA: hypothetical protein VNS80_09520, partial [Pseudolysinimonas sp.]|nr:hypothetical protein [Pseudolysinimonas sp.]
MSSSHPTTSPSPWRRVVGLGIALSAGVALIVLAFAWPNITSEPKDLPLVIAGPDAQVAVLQSVLEERTEGLFEVSVVEDRDAAVAAIERRDAYGAIVISA